MQDDDDDEDEGNNNENDKLAAEFIEFYKPWKIACGQDISVKAAWAIFRVSPFLKPDRKSSGHDNRRGEATDKGQQGSGASEDAHSINQGKQTVSIMQQGINKCKLDDAKIDRFEKQLNKICREGPWRIDQTNGLISTESTSGSGSSDRTKRNETLAIKKAIENEGKLAMEALSAVAYSKWQEETFPKNKNYKPDKKIKDSFDKDCEKEFRSKIKGIQKDLLKKLNKEEQAVKQSRTITIDTVADLFRENIPRQEAERWGAALPAPTTAAQQRPTNFDKIYNHYKEKRGKGAKSEEEFLEIWDTLKFGTSPKLDNQTKLKIDNLIDKEDPKGKARKN